MESMRLSVVSPGEGVLQPCSDDIDITEHGVSTSNAEQDVCL